MASMLIIVGTMAGSTDYGQGAANGTNSNTIQYTIQMSRVDCHQTMGCVIKQCEGPEGQLSVVGRISN